MRFDDSLATVLSSDMAPGLGARSAWRQLVDLIARGRAAADDAAIDRLRRLRASVPAPIRAASGRAIAAGGAPAALVALFAEDDAAIAGDVLRTVALPTDDWIRLLPRLGSQGRSVLRHRRDLPDAVVRALASFGSTDFVLSHDAPAVAVPVVPVPPADTPLSETPFQALGQVAQALPFVAEARRRAAAAPAADTTPRFEIADLVARIDAFQKDRPVPTIAAADATVTPTSFTYETDASGTIRRVEGIARGLLVGLSLATGGAGAARLDAVAAGALRRRARFADARLEVAGGSAAAGGWRLSGVPMFDPASGRFTGMQGTGRRPRADQSAAPRGTGADALRQLVHELRTPATAIMGFAELIGAELLGPVPGHYRERANAIRDEADGLVAAIEDLDTAARIEGGALDLRPGGVAVAPLLARIAADLTPLAALRRVALTIAPADDAAIIAADDRAVERLIARLLAAIVSAGSAGEAIGIAVQDEGARIGIAIDRPAALATGGDDDALFRLDGDADQAAGAPLLGIGFTLRLARNLAGEMGGELAITADRLMVRLPALSGQSTERTAAAI